MVDFTIVISRAHPATPATSRIEDDLAARASMSGQMVIVMPHVYHLSPGAPCLSALRRIEGPLTIFSWLHPRAAFWILSKLGIRGTRGPDTGASGKGRPIHCFRLNETASADELLGEALATSKLRSPGHPAAQLSTGTVSRFEDELKERWYPVIDYERCTNCLECLEFCLFGVYDRNAEGRIDVANPAACKPGCPACSRVCPSQAIVFPLYEEDPAIAGSDDGTIRPFDPSAVARLREAYERGTATIGDVVKACACKDRPCDRPEQPDACDCDCDCECKNPPSKGDDFDQLIDRLVKE